VGHASQCEMTHTYKRAGINILISWSVTATDKGVSLSSLVLAIDNPFSAKCVLLVMQKQVKP